MCRVPQSADLRTSYGQAAYFGSYYRFWVTRLYGWDLFFRKLVLEKRGRGMTLKAQPEP